MNLELLELHLLNRYKKRTVENYLCHSMLFINAVGIENLSALRYKDVMEYIATLRQRDMKPNTIAGHVVAIKALFNYMVKAGLRVDNPAYGIILKDSFHKPLQFQDLLTSEELKLLLIRRDVHQELKFRNQVMMGLLIYQALLSRELVGLRLSDVDLEQKEIFVAAKTHTLSRILKLEPSQLYAFENYIKYERPLLQGKREKESNILLLSRTGKPINNDDIHYQLLRSKPLFPDKKLDGITIRQSVIVNKFLTGWQLRDVQLFAGIKYASTVERYRPVDRQALRDSLMRFHPMG